MRNNYNSLIFILIKILLYKGIGIKKWKDQKNWKEVYYI